MDFLKHNSLRRSIAILVGICTLAPSRVLGIVECEALDIGLEIAIGDTTKISGLTEYVTVVYQFIVATITIVAAVAIMYWGFRWITAAGNQTVIGSAKEGVVSALIGLMIGLTSYIILFTINASLVSFPSICATGISFQNFGSTWETCQSKTSQDSRECSSYDYCQFTDGCSCGPIQGSPTLYCLPLATNEIPADVRCQTDANCKTPLRCAGGATLYAGQCKQLNYDAPCTDDSACQSPLICIDTGIQGRCLTVTGRSNGQYCEEDNECDSAVCCDAGNCSIHFRTCVDGGEGVYCVDDDQCQWGYTCENTACTAKSIGSSCDTENGCPGTLHCVDTRGYGDTCQSGAEGAYCDFDAHCTASGAQYCVDEDGLLGESSCTDGSDGDPCDNDAECTSQSCWGDICLSFGSAEGAHCASDSDCGASAPHCVQTRCYNGSNNDRCEDNNDCTSGFCRNSSNICYYPD